MGFNTSGQERGDAEQRELKKREGKLFPPLSLSLRLGENTGLPMSSSIIYPENQFIDAFISLVETLFWRSGVVLEPKRAKPDGHSSVRQDSTLRSGLPRMVSGGEAEKKFSL